MSEYDDFRTPSTKCPVCKKKLDAATCTEGDYRPSPGDLSICLYCQAWLRFTDDMYLRLFVEDDLKDFPPEQIARIKEITKEVAETMKERE